MMQALARSIVRRSRRRLMTTWPGGAALRRPTFIVGCGRSGTTVLGEVIAAHRQVAYLNEPRDIWALDPQTDIWSAQAERRHGRLVLGAGDVDAHSAQRIEDALAAELRWRGGARLVEKMPINSFRLPYLAAMFPDARFVHLIRNGIDVARSIALLAANGGWYGHGQYKWRLLVAHAEAEGAAQRIAADDAFSRGLLEWYLSVTQARRDLGRIPQERWLELRYEDLLAAPGRACAQIEALLDIPSDEAMHAFAATRLKPRPSSIPPEAPQTVNAVAGDLLAELGYTREPSPPAIDR